MARRGQTRAFLKELRRKHKLGEFAPKNRRSVAKRKKPVTKRSARRASSRRLGF